MGREMSKNTRPFRALCLRKLRGAVTMATRWGRAMFAASRPFTKPGLHLILFNFCRLLSLVVLITFVRNSVNSNPNRSPVNSALMSISNTLPLLHLNFCSDYHEVSLHEWVFIPLILKFILFILAQWLL